MSIRPALAKARLARPWSLGLTRRIAVAIAAGGVLAFSDALGGNNRRVITEP